MNDRTCVDGLPETWRKRARELCEYGGETPAVAIESSAAQLEKRSATTTRPPSC